MNVPTATKAPPRLPSTPPVSEQERVITAIRKNAALQKQISRAKAFLSELYVTLGDFLTGLPRVSLDRSEVQRIIQNQQQQWAAINTSGRALLKTLDVLSKKPAGTIEQGTSLTDLLRTQFIAFQNAVSRGIYPLLEKLLDEKNPLMSKYNFGFFVGGLLKDLSIEFKNLGTLVNSISMLEMPD